MMLIGALCWHSELPLRRLVPRRALMVTELEEFGDRVELVPRRALRQDELRDNRVQGGASTS